MQPIYPVGLKKYKDVLLHLCFSEKDEQFYTGYTADIKKRLVLHNEGRVESTKNRRPLKLIYWEGCLNSQDAT